MRLNYKTYPIWQFVEHPHRILAGMEVDSALMDKLGRTPHKIIEYTTGMAQVVGQVKETFYVSQPFQRALETALPRLEKEKYWEVEPLAACGALIFNDGMTVYLCNPGDSMLKLAVYGFTRTANTCFAFLTNKNEIGGSYPVINPQTGKVEERPDLMRLWVNSILAMLYFIKNVEIETKVVKPGEKYRTKGKWAEKHFNESRTNVTILDCTWFTELIAVHGHKVTGHLRKQPFGPRNNPKYKFIWIDEYEKGEYKRRAKKEIYEENKGAE